MNAAGRDYRSLSRIAAMLVALAVLAERAGSRSLPVRFVVLAILRRAETVAHGFVVEATQTTWPYFEEERETAYRPVDAAWLAWRFRLLAAVLGALMRLASGADRWNAGIGSRDTRLASRRVLMTCGGSDARALRLRPDADNPRQLRMVDPIGCAAGSLRGPPGVACGTAKPRSRFPATSAAVPAASVRPARAPESAGRFPAGARRG